MPNNPPEGNQHVIPYLTYADAPAAIHAMVKVYAGTHVKAVAPAGVRP